MHNDRILKTIIQLKPEHFMLGVMGSQLEKSQGRLFLYRSIAKECYMDKNGVSELPKTEEWLVKMPELAEMAKLT